MSISLSDGSSLRGVTRWSWGALRLRQVAAFNARGEENGTAPTLIVNVGAVVSVQVF